MARGRPARILSDDRALTIINAIRNGNTRATAAALAGVGKSTLFAWLDKGRPDDETGEYPKDEFGKLRRAVEQADAECEQDMVKTVKTAAFGYQDEEGIYRPGDWKAALEFLQRKNPGEWGKIERSKVELTGKDGGPVEVDVNDAKGRLLAGIKKLQPKPESSDGEA